MCWAISWRSVCLFAFIYSNDCSAGVAFDSAVTRASGPVADRPGFLRPLGRVCHCPPYLSCSASFSLVTVVLISGIPRNELTDNWTQYFDERYQFRRDTDFVISRT